MASNAPSGSLGSVASHKDGGMKAPQGTGLMSRMALNDNKAGMEGLDKEKINQIIYEASKGSKFYENERKKEEQLDQRLGKLKSYASQITARALQEGQKQADLLLEKLKMERDLSHTIVHVDMDAFYAAVEMRDDPSLRSIPMAVGGMGMLSTSNYLARKFGVRAAMPGFIGLKLCPALVIVKPNFDKYIAVSQEIRQVLSLYDPNFCPMSLDEAYLDFSQHLENRKSSLISERAFILRCNNESNSNEEVSPNLKDGATDACRCDLNEVLLPSILNSSVLLSLIGDEVEFQSYISNFDQSNLEAVNEGIPTSCPVCNKVFPRYNMKVYGRSIEDAVLEMRNRIQQRTHLTASAGIAPNMMIAKICSDRNKPNGQYRIMPEIAQIENFIEDLPIRKVSGIGKVTEKLLGGLDVIKCSDIYSKRSLLYHLFSPGSFEHFLSISLGLGSTTVERDDERKSISTEETFSEISDVTELCSKCQALCEEVGTDMKRESIKGKTVTLKLKTITFEVMTRSHTLPELTNDPNVIFNAAKKLLIVELQNLQPAKLRLRLMGVRMSKLDSTKSSEQVTVRSMFSKYKEKETAATSKSNNHTHGPNVTNNDEVEDAEDEEDFSRPLTDTFYPVMNQKDSKRDFKSNGLSPSKAKNESKKHDVISSSSIVQLFARQKEMKSTQPSQSHNAASGMSKQKMPKPESFFKKLNHKNSVNRSDEGTNRMEQHIMVLEDDEAASSSRVHSDSVATITCPICATRLSECDLLALNSHIDSCLNRQTIQEILQEERIETHNQSENSNSKNKRPRLEEHSPHTNARHPGKTRKVQSSVLSYFQS